MIRWTLLDTAPVADGDDDLRLMRRGDEFSIMAGAIELMNSRLSGSEEALATLACERLQGRPAPHVLIGGLGMGFTLRAALDRLGAEARITVVELIPAVVAWARGPLAGVFRGSLDNPRVRIVEADVAAVLEAGRANYDAVLLDVDNGPKGLIRSANDALYGAAGLDLARRALTPGGVLAVWSAAPDEGFGRRLREAGYAVTETRVRANAGRRGARHTVWVTTSPDG